MIGQHFETICHPDSAHIRSQAHHNGYRRICSVKPEKARFYSFASVPSGPARVTRRETHRITLDPAASQTATAARLARISCHVVPTSPNAANPPSKTSTIVKRNGVAQQLGEQELRDYFTYLINKKRLAASTLHTYIFAIKFFFTKTLQKPWPTLKLLRDCHCHCAGNSKSSLKPPVYRKKCACPACPCSALLSTAPSMCTMAAA